MLYLCLILSIYLIATSINRSRILYKELVNNINGSFGLIITQANADAINLHLRQTVKTMIASILNCLALLLLTLCLFFRYFGETKYRNDLYISIALLALMLSFVSSLPWYKADKNKVQLRKW